MDTNQSAEDAGRAAMRRFLAALREQPHRRLVEPAREAEPERIGHPAWFRGAWEEALGGRRGEA